jgi:hypothetical protein
VTLKRDPQPTDIWAMGQPLFDDEELIGHDSAAARAYRLHHRMAIGASVLVAVVAISFAYAAISVLIAGGDTRFGIFPFFGFAATSIAGFFVLRALWRQSAESRWEMLHPVPDLELPPEMHLTITQRIDPPRRW